MRTWCEPCLQCRMNAHTSLASTASGEAWRGATSMCWSSVITRASMKHVSYTSFIVCQCHVDVHFREKVTSACMAGFENVSNEKSIKSIYMRHHLLWWALVIDFKCSSLAREDDGLFFVFLLFLFFCFFASFT